MVYRFGEFELDEEARQLRRGGEPVVLQPLIFNLLAFLVRNHRRVVSKDELLDTIWPDADVSEASLQRAISLARSALSDGSHLLIRTFKGYGYRFLGNVQVDEPPVFGHTLSAMTADAHEDPRIQYTRTSDGVRIAYWTVGNGPPLVYIPNMIWSHGRLEWRFPEIRAWYEMLARNRQLVRFDPRGTGSSQREVEHYSLSSIQLDLEAVVHRLDLAEFAMFADLNSGPVAIRYAADHPERVSRLILWHTFANTEDIDGPKMRMLESLQPLMIEDWETYTETRAHMGFGWADGASAHNYAALMRESVSPEMALRCYTAQRGQDVTPLLPRITAPTLVLHRRHFYLWDVRVSQDLAARIPDSSLILLEGAGSAPFLGDSESVVAAIDSFLGK